MVFKLLIAFLSGIISLNFLSCWDVCLLIVCLIIANSIVSLIFKSRKFYRNLIFMFIILGATISFYSSSYESCGLYPLDDKFIEISGYVYDIPKENNGRYTYIIKTDGAKYKDEIYYVTEYVKLNTDEKLSYAQNVGVKGFLTKIKTKMNYSDFDYVSYFKSNGIFYKISDFEIASDNTIRKTFSQKYISDIYKTRVSEFVSRLGGDEGALLKAVLTGQRTGFSDEYKDILLKTNTIRMLYPAYLHIFLIIALSEFVFMYFGRKTRDYAKIFLVLVYALIFSANFSGIKTALAIVFSVIVVRKYGYLHYPDVLSLVLLVLLGFNPLLAYNTGFIISVLMSWVFFMLRPVVYEKLKNIKSYTLRTILTVYIISTIGILPIGAYFFNAVSVYSGFFNIVYFPLIILIILSFPLLCLEFLLFSKGLVAGYVMSGAVFILHKIPYLIDKLPFSHIGIAKPGIITVIMCYLAVIVIKDFHYNHRHFLRTKLIISAIVGTIVSSAIIAVSSFGTMSINFVNVGQGDGCYIKLPKGENIIIDGGGGEEFSDYDAGKELFLPYLKSEGAYRIDLAILSHYHKDHCLGTIAALENLKVQAILMPNHMEDSEYRKEIETLAKEKNVNRIYPENGYTITFESGAKLKIISAGNNFSENDSSLVFTITCNNFTALFTGDASSYTENKHIDDLYDVDLLKVAHHGSKTSTSKEFLRKVTPEYAVISVGEDNTYMLPDTTVLKRLKKCGSYVMRTDKLGDIRFKVSGYGRVSFDSYYQDTKDWG